MIKRIEIGVPPRHEVFAEPTPMGLLGLAIGCAALTPIAFGAAITPASLRTAAIFCLLFGAGGQFLAGLLSLANHNLYGGTLFTTFAFNWVLNAWVLDGVAKGLAPDKGTILAADVCFLVIFVVLTYGFGFFSKLLFAFLLDIDLLFACRLVNGFAGTRAFDLPIAIFTVGLGLLSLWVAFAMLINPTAGKSLFPMAGPLFVARPRPAFDVSTRRAIFDVLYSHWREHAYRALPLADLEAAVRERLGERAIAPDLFYLQELGGVHLLLREPDQIMGARLTAAGIDFYEQVVFKKDQFA